MKLGEKLKGESFNLPGRFSFYEMVQRNSELIIFKSFSKILIITIVTMPLLSTIIRANFTGKLSSPNKNKNISI
jgi:hypothetical protein